MCPSSSLFQPTLPLRGATSRRCRPSREASCFNPRSPCGERRASGAWRLTKPPVFQPTLPLRGATTRIVDKRDGTQFQPTLPLRGATPTTSRLCSASTFQPTLPLRGATFAHGVSSVSGHVSTHAPLAGSDRRSRSRTFRTGRVSTHAPLAGSDVPVTQLSARLLVSTHAPLAGSDPRGRDA